MHNSLVSLEEFLVLVRSVAPLAPGLLVAVHGVVVSVQLDLVIEDLAAVFTSENLRRSVHLVLVVPQRSLVLQLGQADVALDGLDPVHVLDVLLGGELPTERADLLEKQISRKHFTADQQCLTFSCSLARWYLRSRVVLKT